MSKTKKKAPRPAILNRYTSLPVLLDVLHNKHITLLSPDSWEDRNDAFYLERYQAEGKCRSVLAICFSLHRETFHHWRVFSSGPSGVCIEFDKDQLIECVSEMSGYRWGKVDYRWISELSGNKPPLSSWPFLKRKPYEDEREFRIIFESRTERLTHKSLPIELAYIRRVTLSPWLPSPIASTVIASVKAIPGCDRLKVEPSSLINNAGWRKAID